MADLKPADTGTLKEQARKWLQSYVDEDYSAAQADLDAADYAAFAKLQVEQEREACAIIVDTYGHATIAAAIRARGGKP